MYFHLELETMAIGHSSAQCWPCELRCRWGSFNSATSSAHKQYIHWEFSAVARTQNIQWVIAAVVMHSLCHCACSRLTIQNFPTRQTHRLLSPREESNRFNIHTARLRDPSRMWWCLIAKFVEMLAVSCEFGSLHSSCSRFVCCVCERGNSIRKLEESKRSNEKRSSKVSFLIRCDISLVDISTGGHKNVHEQ